MSPLDLLAWAGIVAGALIVIAMGGAVATAVYAGVRDALTKDRAT